MIRINLLPLRKKKKKPTPVPGFLVASVILLVLSLVTTFYFNYFMKSKIASLDAQKAQNGQKIAMLQSKLKEVKNFETLNKKFSDRKKIIEELKKDQVLPVKLLDEISMRLTDGVWLQDLSITSDSISMSGTGYTNDDVVTFVQNLKASPFFTDVYLNGTSKSSSDGISVYNFSLTMKVKA
ncbi:MAG: PilN domain-containing protein [Nitrospiraceae bacterium]|nr:PilN domain-containing protein [Nitrospiraceae bacterium]